MSGIEQNTANIGGHSNRHTAERTREDSVPSFVPWISISAIGVFGGSQNCKASQAICQNSKCDGGLAVCCGDKVAAAAGCLAPAAERAGSSSRESRDTSNSGLLVYCSETSCCGESRGRAYSQQQQREQQHPAAAPSSRAPSSSSEWLACGLTPSSAEPATGAMLANRFEKSTPVWYAIMPPLLMPVLQPHAA